MRLLHAGHGDELRPAREQESSLHARRCADCHLGSPVPLRHLSKHFQGDVGGSGSGAKQRDAIMSDTAPSESRSVTAGIVGGSMDRVDRKVPSTEPPEWPANAELQVIGKPVLRMDALE